MTDFSNRRYLFVLTLLAVCAIARPGAAGNGQSSANTEVTPLEDFSTLDPIYFVLGTSPTDAKFQLSFKFRLIGSDDGPAASVRPWQEKFFFAVTQTSFWDLASESKPFKDSNFKPALMYQFDAPDWSWFPRNEKSYIRVAV